METEKGNSGKDEVNFQERNVAAGTGLINTCVTFSCH